MKNSILSLEGVEVLSKKERKSILGGQVDKDLKTGPGGYGNGPMSGINCFNACPPPYGCYYIYEHWQCGYP